MAYYIDVFAYTDSTNKPKDNGKRVNILERTSRAGS